MSSRPSSLWRRPGDAGRAEPVTFLQHSYFIFACPAFRLLTLLCPYFSARLPCCALFFLRKDNGFSPLKGVFPNQHVITPSWTRKGTGTGS